MPLFKPRPRNPEPIRLTERDTAIFETLYAFDGLMSRRQIAALFFNGVDGSSVKTRLRQLFEHAYINQADRNQIGPLPAGEWVYWLDTKGYHYLASLQGKEAEGDDLRRNKLPSWQYLHHHLKVNNFRILVLQALKQHPELRLTTWVSERSFNRWTTKDDQITYTYGSKVVKKSVVPDSFFIVTAPHPQRQGVSVEFAFVVEVDRGQEQLSRIDDEKLYAGLAYLKSSVYKQRLKVDYGRYLIVTDRTRQHMDNMLALVPSLGERNQKAFYFTTFDLVKECNILVDPVWWQAGSEVPIPIIPLPTSY